MIVLSTFGVSAISSSKACIQNKITMNKVLCNTCIWHNMFVKLTSTSHKYLVGKRMGGWVDKLVSEWVCR
jgi:hypothetical protein